jgi:pimeloyl-ACP methyl ester carboxylesterase
MTGIPDFAIPEENSPMTSHVTSADGTRIAYETLGAGPALILVDGAMSYRDFGPARGLATALADQYTVYIYDRRGRGDSGNTLPWAEDREIDDLAALLDAAGGTAHLFGCSSGAVLAADAAHRLPGFTTLALYEPPFIVDDTRAPREATFTQDTEDLIARDDRSGAIKKFMRHVGVPAVVLAVMPLTPPWRKLKVVAPTLPYDLRILGDTGRGAALDANRWSGVTIPAIVMDGGKSPQYLRNGAKALSEALPKATYRTLPGQTHIFKASVLAPALKQFLNP